jgi:hypothetical protein
MASKEIMEALKDHGTTRLPSNHVVRFRVTRTRKRQAIFSSPGRGRWFKQIRFPPYQKASMCRYYMRVYETGSDAKWRFGALFFETPWAGTDALLKMGAPLVCPWGDQWVAGHVVRPSDGEYGPDPFSYRPSQGDPPAVEWQWLQSPGSDLPVKWSKSTKQLVFDMGCGPDADFWHTVANPPEEGIIHTVRTTSMPLQPQPAGAYRDPNAFTVDRSMVLNQAGGAGGAPLQGLMQAGGMSVPQDLADFYTHQAMLQHPGSMLPGMMRLGTNAARDVVGVQHGAMPGMSWPPLPPWMMSANGHMMAQPGVQPPPNQMFMQQQQYAFGAADAAASAAYWNALQQQQPAMGLDQVPVPNPMVSAQQNPACAPHPFLQGPYGMMVPGMAPPAFPLVGVPPVHDGSPFSHAIAAPFASTSRAPVKDKDSPKSAAEEDEAGTGGGPESKKAKKRWGMISLSPLSIP